LAGLEESEATRIFNGFESLLISGGRPNPIWKADRYARKRMLFWVTSSRTINNVEQRITKSAGDNEDLLDVLLRLKDDGQVKMEQQLSNTDASLAKSWSSKNGTATTSDYEEITTCKMEPQQVSMVKKLQKLSRKKVQLILTNTLKLTYVEPLQLAGKGTMIWSDDPDDLSIQVTSLSNFKVVLVMMQSKKVMTFDDPKQQAHQ
ncbi:3-phosphoinositide-dependent protein kinase 2 isoform X1, partial [Tanacetum coccineum]